MDIKDNLITWEDEEGSHNAPLYSEESYKVITHLWLKIGWQFHTHYAFSWMGRPVLQLPEDLIRIQELIFTLKPDLIIETGVALGGSLLFYASLVHAMNHGKVVGIDIDLRPATKAALTQHELSSHITLIEGSSIARATVAKVAVLCKDAATVLVILDSNHSKQHVYEELSAYAPLVTSGSYILVADGFKKYLHDVPRGKSEWNWDNPHDAVRLFLEENPLFELAQPRPPYYRAKVSAEATHFVDGYLRKK